MFNIIDLPFDILNVIIVHLTLPSFIMLSITYKRFNSLKDLHYTYAQYILKPKIDYYIAKQFEFSELLIYNIDRIIGQGPYNTCRSNSNTHQIKTTIRLLQRKCFIIACMTQKHNYTRPVQSQSNRVQLKNINLKNGELLFKIKYIIGCGGCPECICNSKPCIECIVHNIIDKLNANGNILNHDICPQLPQYKEFIHNECLILLHKHYYNIWIQYVKIPHTNKQLHTTNTELTSCSHITNIQPTLISSFHTTYTEFTSSLQYGYNTRRQRSTADIQQIYSIIKVIHVLYYKCIKHLI